MFSPSDLIFGALLRDFASITSHLCKHKSPISVSFWYSNFIMLNKVLYRRVFSISSWNIQGDFLSSEEAGSTNLSPPACTLRTLNAPATLAVLDGGRLEDHKGRPKGASISWDKSLYSIPFDFRIPTKESTRPQSSIQTPSHGGHKALSSVPVPKPQKDTKGVVFTRLHHKISQVQSG